MRGEACYQKLVDVCRALGVVTSEDPYPTWQTATVPVVVAPLFVLYDYAFRPAGTFTKEKDSPLRRPLASSALTSTSCIQIPTPPVRTGVVRGSHTRETGWPASTGYPTALVNHWPLHCEPMQILRHPEFGLWYGTAQTARWHIEYNAKVVVYGHLHIPRTIELSGVRFEDVSVGYPRQWKAQQTRSDWLHEVLPGVPNQGSEEA